MADEDKKREEALLKAAKQMQIAMAPMIANMQAISKAMEPTFRAIESISKNIMPSLRIMGHWQRSFIPKRIIQVCIFLSPPFLQPPSHTSSNQ